MPKGLYRNMTYVVILLTTLFHLSFLLVQINLCTPVRTCPFSALVVLSYRGTLSFTSRMENCPGTCHGVGHHNKCSHMLIVPLGPSAMGLYHHKQDLPSVSHCLYDDGIFNDLI